MQSNSTACVPALVEGIDYDKNRTNDVQVLKWFQNEGFEEGIIVMGAASKSAVVLYDVSERDFKRRIAVSEIASKSRKEVISLPNGLFPPKEDERGRKAVQFVEKSCNLVCDRRLSRACLSEKNETTLRGRVIHPIDNEVQECYACSQKTTFVGTKSRVEFAWDFSDFCIEF